MPPPPVTIYITSLTSHPTVRSHTELLHRGLTGNRITYEAFDLAADETAKTRWQRAKPVGKVIGLPGYLVGGDYVGDMIQFEEAVESGTLKSFLKQDITVPSTGPANMSGSVSQAELDQLMNELSEGDAQQLASEMDKVGQSSRNPASRGIDTHVTKNGSVNGKSNGTSASTSAIGMPKTTSALNAGGKLAFGSPPSAGLRSSPPLDSERQKSPAGSTKGGGDRKSKEDLAREMAEAGTLDGLIAAMEEAEGKEKIR